MAPARKCAMVGILGLMRCAPARPLTAEEDSVYSLMQIGWKTEENLSGVRKGAVQMNTAMLSRMRAKSGQGRACGCLEWKEVYEQRGVTCGQGLEFFTWLGRGRLEAGDPSLEHVRVNQSSLYKQVCSNFFEKLHGNRAVRIKFNTPPAERNQLWDNSWCYVSPACEVDEGQVPGSGERKNLTMKKFSGLVQGAPMGIKVLSENIDDTVMSEMNPNAIIRAANQPGEVEGGYDLTTMMGFAFYAYQDTNKTPSKELQKQIAETGAPIMILPPERFATRLLVKGGEKWTIKQGQNRTSSPGSWWAGDPKYDK